MKKLRHRTFTAEKERSIRLARPAAIGAGLALATGFGRYGLLDYKINEWENAKTRNLPHNQETVSLCNNILSDSKKYESDYRYILEKGGTGLSELEWVALKRIFSENGIPFRVPYVDLKSKDLLGKGIEKIAVQNDSVKKSVEKWREIREDALKESIPKKNDAEQHLLDHIDVELQLEKGLNSFMLQKQTLPMRSAYTGLAAGGGIFFVLVLLQVAMVARRKLYERSIERAAKLREKQPKDADAPAKENNNERPVSDGKEKRYDSKVILKKQNWDSTAKFVLADLAKARLRGEMGDEFASVIFEVLAEKMSSRLLGEIVEGKYLNLIRNIRHSNKAFEVRGYAPRDIVIALAGEDYFDKSPPDGIDLPHKKRHPFDHLSRWGWNSGRLHDLLHEHGFDTGENDGSGQHFIQYNGKKMRGEDGKCITIPGRGSNGELKPGLVDKVLKRCANFLSGLETE